jgi:hypothetical protein
LVALSSPRNFSISGSTTTSPSATTAPTMPASVKTNDTAVSLMKLRLSRSA